MPPAHRLYEACVGGTAAELGRMETRMNIVQVGLGPLGQKIVRFALERGTIDIIGAVDPAADKVGKDLGELCGVGKLGVVVRKDLASALNGRKADAAALSTVSSLAKIEPQIAELAAAGLNIVSTIPGGVNGDIATCAITINALRSIVTAKPGLRTMTDIPAVAYSAGF